MKFEKNISQMIKGIAIIIMVFHHLFAERAWLLPDVDYFTISIGSTSLEQYIAAWGKICISVYAFISGYGLYVSFESRQQKYRDSLRRFWKVLCNWMVMVLLIFLPFSLCFTGKVSGMELFKNLLLIDPSWCPFADYLQFYLLLTLTYPFIYKVLKKINIPILVLVAMPFLSIVLRKVLSMAVNEGFVYQLVYFYLLYIPYLVAGSCVKQCNLYEKAYGLLPDKKLVKNGLCLLLLILLVPLRVTVLNNKMVFDSYLATIFVFLCTSLLQEREKTKSGKLLIVLGENSTNIWFLHAIFFFTFAEYTQRIVYLPHIPVLITAWCIVLCLPFSYCINWILAFMERRKKAFREKKVEGMG